MLSKPHYMRTKMTESVFLFSSALLSRKPRTYFLYLWLYLKRSFLLLRTLKHKPPDPPVASMRKRITARQIGGGGVPQAPCPAQYV